MIRRAPMSVLEKVLLLAGAIGVIIFAGGWMYAVLEGLPYRGAVYNVVMIMTGIGTGRDPVSKGGQLFNILLALVSVGLLVGVLGQIFRYISARSLKDVAQGFHDRRVRTMTGHTILCGTSNTLRELLRRMERDGRLPQVWVVVRTPDDAKRLEAEGFHVHVDDFTAERALQEAGIETAGCVIALGENDAENAFVALTAKHLRKAVPVIARLTRSENREKLHAAGADEIVAPAELAAAEIETALEALRGKTKAR